MDKQAQAQTRLAPDEFRVVGRDLENHPYRFAKTMPENPHWYTLRKEWAADGSFDRAVAGIRAGGFDELYGGYWYRVMNVNGHKYWTMGAPVEETILINRKPRDYAQCPYDQISTTYDDIHSRSESLRENEDVMELIGDVSGLSVLDIGCGTGLLLDYQKPASYVGLDPSTGMLDRLIEKHRDYIGQHTLYACSFEEFVGDPVDLAVCLFGSVAYIDEDYVAAIPSYVKPGGRYVVMFLDDDYEPYTYGQSGVYVEDRRGEFGNLPGERSRIGEFIVVDGIAK